MDVQLVGNSNIEISSSKKSKKTLPSPSHSSDEIASAKKRQQQIHRFTDKMFCPNCNITYPEFTTQYFSPNRQD
jgi:excinuclease UvrABC ATPase subunit